MKKFISLGSYNLAFNELCKFNLAVPPKKSCDHLSAIFLKIDLIGTATGNIDKNTLVNNLIKRINLQYNEKIVVDNMSGQSLSLISGLLGCLSPFTKYPSISEGNYSVSYIEEIPLSSDLFEEKYDFALNTNLINNLVLDVEINSNIDKLGLSSATCKVYASVIKRLNDYVSPLLKIKKYTISNSISDTINLPNRVLFAAFELPHNANLNDSFVMRSKYDNQIIDFLSFKEIAQYLAPVKSAMINEIKYYNNYFILPFDAPISVKKPLFFEGDSLFFDDLDSVNSPFDFVSLEILPVKEDEYQIIEGVREFFDRHSPIKIKDIGKVFIKK